MSALKKIRYDRKCKPGANITNIIHQEKFLWFEYSGEMFDLVKFKSPITICRAEYLKLSPAC